MKTGKRKIFGTTERPRLSVYVSAKHIHAQIIDDEQAVTMAAASTLEKGRKKDEKSMSNINGAKIVGEKLGKAAVAKGVKKVVFDRGKKKYHGKVKALAEAARAAGLEF